jgi:hypothetical protein
MMFEDVTPESLDAAAQRLLGQDEPPPTEEEEEEPDAGGTSEETEPDTETAEEPGDEPEGEEGPPEGQPPPADPEARGFVGYKFDDLGVVVDESTARIYAETDYRLRNDPAFLKAFQAALGLGEGPAAAKVLPQAPEPPPDPFEDPDRYVAWVTEQAALRARQRVMEELGPQFQKVEAHDRYIQDQNRTTATRIVESVVSSFQTDKGLTDEDMKEIRSIAQVRPGNNPDPYHQVRDAFEVAYWSIPRFRERAISEERATWEADRRKQKKLAAVTGTSGSVSRNPPEPRTADERKAGLRKAVEELWRGNAINE